RRRFTGQRVMDVYADTTSPMYLRTWVGGEYKENAWYPPDLKDVPVIYRPDMPEEDASRVTENFFDLLASVYGEETYEKLGFSNAVVTMLPTASGQLVPLPVTTRSLLGSEGFSALRVSDGLYACLSLPGLPYSTWSIVPYDRGGECAYRFEEAILGYYDFSRYCREGEIPEGINPIGQKLCQTLDRDKMEEYLDFAKNRDQHIAYLYTDVPYSEGIVTVVRDLLENTAIAQYYRKEFVDRLSFEQSAGNYMEEAICLRSAEADGYDIYRLDETAAATAGEAVARIVSSYLTEHYAYSLDPAESVRYTDAIDAFLLDSKEGYCVQFATAGTLILRGLGFAARYAEGYLADDFGRNGSRDYTQAYRSRVRDHNAHSWCEVWVHGFGWVVAEMTPGYAGILYRDPPKAPETTAPDTNVPDTTEPPTTTLPPETTKEDDTTEPPETNPDETTESDGDAVTDPPSTDTEDTSHGITSPIAGVDLTPLLLAIVILLPPVVLGMLVVRRDRRLAAKRRGLLRRAADPESLSAEERQRLGKELTASLTAVLGAYRLLPQHGEMPSAFAVRADKTLASLSLNPLPSEAVSSLMAQVYGGAMSEKDLRIASRFLAVLIENAGKHLGIFRYVWYRFGRGIL
ncbi:MAG: transglutaminase domain-containing protein, partial [Ruminococcaceae bacterium]|nr:transglutaminase domain-containing protein [Oscillospiraceae bacterium]